MREQSGELEGGRGRNSYVLRAPYLTGGPAREALGDPIPSDEPRAVRDQKHAYHPDRPQVSVLQRTTGYTCWFYPKPTQQGVEAALSEARSVATGVNKKKESGTKRGRGASLLSPQVIAEMSDDELLNVRLCDLDLQIKGTALEARIERAVSELREHDLDFKPHFWLSDEWFCADGIPGIAIPFYLAHPRLERLERSQLLEVEGGDEEWCLKILRHELGHAIENAFRTRRLQARRKLFGKSTEPYPEYYSPRPYSKSFVLHLDPWYAQSHPDEDFAETFAVWLTPQSQWRERYAGWPALKKLEYMDSLMQSLRGKTPPVRNNKVLDPLSRYTKTLREHYENRKKKYGKEHPSFYDKDLRVLFSSAPEFVKNPTAASLIKRRRKVIRATVSRWTGAYQYTTDQVLDAIVQRCAELNLRLTSPEDVAVKEFTVLLTVQTMNYLHSGRHRIAL